jgi:hypothetical protein
MKQLTQFVQPNGKTTTKMSLLSQKETDIQPDNSCRNLLPTNCESLTCCGDWFSCLRVCADGLLTAVMLVISCTWVLIGSTIQKLLVFRRKILRRIFGPTKENKIRRIKTDEELDKLKKKQHRNMVNYITARRLSWFGHIQRMPDTRTVKKIFKWNHLIKRSKGRSKYRWEDNIKQDICLMKVKNWIICIQNREKWKEVVEKTKTF